MTTTIFDLQKNVIQFAKNNRESHTSIYSGFYAGDGENWIKCADHEAALSSKLKYIFFIKGDTATLYQA